MRRCRLLGLSPLLLFILPAGLYAQIGSIQRDLYNSPLIDSVLRNQFPRGGSYTAVIQGSGLAHVTAFGASDPNVSGSVTSAADTRVTVQISSTAVKEGQTASAPIPGVSFTLFQTPPSGQPPLPPISSGPVTFDIITGPQPQGTWKITNSVIWVPSGVATVVKYESVILDAGNIQFFYIGGNCCGTASSWTITGSQFQSTSDLTIVVTGPVDFSATSYDTFYGAVDGCGQGGTSGNAPTSPSKTVKLPIVQMQLVDPVTGNDSTSLLRGPAVTSTLVDLENQNRGTIVTGVAADGATQVVIRIAGAPPGETFSLSLDQDGALAERGSTDFQSSIPALQADPSGKAVVLYRAPDDFAQVGTIASVTAPSRTVHLNFTSTDNPGVTGDTPITVLRPPVLLIHGFWGHPGNWDPFVSNLKTLLGSSLPFSWDYLTYDKPFSALPTITATQPALASQATLNQQLLQSVQTKGDSSALGVLFNAGFVLPQISTLLQQFKNANGVAAVQADVVAHSMGGLVTRAFPQLQGYYADSNFAQGFVHKLISIDTPHLGTPIANQFLSTGAPIGDNTCMRQYQAAKGKLAASTVTMAGYGSVNAAVGDMTGDGFGGGLSPEVAALQGGTANIPTAFIAGNGCGFVNCPFGPISGVLQSYLLLRCSSAPLAQALESFTWPLIFHQDSDAIVPLTSQSNNGRSGSTAAYVFQDVHSPGAKLLLGFTSTSDVLSDTRTAAAVIQLLNKPRCSAGGCQSGAATPFTKLLAA